MFNIELPLSVNPSSDIVYTANAKIKRVFDFFTASILIFCLIPLFVIVTSALFFFDRGPIIFKQTRIGQGGKRFTCFKFRSMVQGSEQFLQFLLDNDLAARAEWERSQKLSNDPRITPIGRFLRQSSLDELPQLINVMRGEMSLVGPRPIVPSEAARYGDKLGIYLLAKPGMTGVWQVSGRNDCGYERRIELDADYVRRANFVSDLAILWRTLSAVILRKGCY